MRLGIDVSPLARNRAGIGNYIAELLAAMVRSAPHHQYFLYTAADLPEDRLPGIGESSSVHISRCHPLLMKWRAARDRLDLFHGMNFRLRGWGRRGGVVTIYDLALDRLALPSRKLLGQRWSFIRTKRTARRATKVVTISEHSAGDISELYGVPRERIAVVTPAVGPGFYREDAPNLVRAIKLRYGIGEGEFLLSGGGSEPRKNIARLVEAFGLLPSRRDLRLVVVGGMARGSEAIFEAVHRAGLGAAVLFPGHVPLPDLRVLYSACVAFVFPSLYEGFGMPVLEAIACGAPVISSNAASLPEVTGEAALLIDPLDVSALAGAMARVRDDRQLRDHLRQAGPIRAKAFSWDQSARDQLRVYQELVPDRVD